MRKSRADRQVRGERSEPQHVALTCIKLAHGEPSRMHSPSKEPTMPTPTTHPLDRWQWLAVVCTGLLVAAITAIGVG